MSDLRTINLRELERRYLEQTLAKEAVQFVSSGVDEAQLLRVLRDHRTLQITDPDEIRLRRAFDDLLAFYSLLELASLIELVPVPLPAEVADAAGKHLRNKAVVAYYERHYPLLLPALFRERVAAGPCLQERADVATIAVFTEFLDTNALIENDPDVEAFLWFLDDGKYGEYSLEQVVQTLASPRVVLESVSLSELDASPVGRGVLGFREFLAFCRALDDLLARAAPYPLLQSGLWHYHAYWFAYLADKVGARLDQAISQLSQWATGPVDTQPPPYAPRPKATEELKQVVRRLTVGAYGRPLRDAAHKILGGPR